MSEFVLKTAAQIGKMVDTAITHTVKGDTLTHEAAVQALGHAARLDDKGVQIGDITLFERLLNGLGKSVRVQGLKVWAQTYSPVAWNGDGKIGLLKAKDKRYKPFDMEAALANPFWTLAEADETTRKPLTIEAMLKVIHGMGKRLDKAVNENQFEGDVDKAKAFVTSIESFADGLVTKLDIRDGAFDPNDPENAPINAVPAPAPAPRRERAKKAA